MGQKYKQYFLIYIMEMTFVFVIYERFATHVIGHLSFRLGLFMTSSDVMKKSRAWW